MVTPSYQPPDPAPSVPPVVIPEALQAYQTAVAVLDSSTNDTKVDTNVVESALLHALTQRDIVKAVMDAGQVRFSSDDIGILIATDAALFTATQHALKTRSISPGKWRYLFQDDEHRDWWWHLDQRPSMQGHTITYGQYMPAPILLGGLLFLLSVGLVLFTTQRLWASGFDWIGFLSLLAQSILGGSLISASGQRFASDAINGVVNLPRRVLRREGQGDIFPLSPRMRASGWGVVAAAGVFFALVVVITLFVFPFLARRTYESAVAAILRQDVASAQTLLNISIQLQPVTFGLVDNDLSTQLTQLGILYEQVGNEASARDSFEEALTHNPQNVVVPYRLAGMYIDAGEYNRALTLLDRVITQLTTGSSEISDPMERTHLLFQTYLTRGRAFLEGYGARYALVDLRQAAALVSENPGWFDQSVGQSFVPTTELHVLLGRVYLGLYEGGSTSFGLLARCAWETVREQSAGGSDYTYRLWMIEAQDANSRLSDVTGECS